MHRRSLFGAVLGFALFWTTAGQALAWNAAGHMAIASIAYDRLPAERRDALVAILRQHPRFQQDFAAAMPAGLDSQQQERWLFMRASIWPDLARNFPEPDRDTYNHPGWHYIDFPIYLDEKAHQQIHVPEYTPEVRAVVEAGENSPHAPLKAVEITPEYLKAARTVAAQRASLGAVRTARLLEEPGK